MIKQPENIFRNYLQLCKIKIMIPVSLTGFTGYFLFTPSFSVSIFSLTLGVLFIAVSATVLNQIQEVDIDRRMERTHNRPLPSGKIILTNAVFFFIATFCAGLILIYSFGNLKAAFIAFATVVWYNGVYTYLKRISAFAVVPGAVTGALPPLIGWVAAGGSVFDSHILFVEFLFFTGQIPHFWLLILNYGEEYKKAGLQSLTEVLNYTQIYRLTFIWVFTSVTAAIFLCYFKIIFNGIIEIILIVASIALLWKFFGLTRAGDGKMNFKTYSILLDSYFLLVIILLISDRILTLIVANP